MNTRILTTKPLLLLLVLFLMCSDSLVTAMPLYPSNNKFIAYSDTGAGQALILIHAFPTDQRLWLPQQEELQKKFRVITLDLWGFGKSAEVVGEAVTMTAYADEVKQLMDQLHLNKAIIGGESMGGYIALAFLEKYPDQVEGLVLSATQTIADTPEAKAKREAAAIDVLQHGTTNLINNFIANALSASATKETKLFLQEILVTQKATGLASALRGMAQRFDTSAVLAKTTLPILIITGDQDKLVSPQQSKNMHQLAKNSKLIIVPGAGHLVSLEQRDAWNKAVIDLFNP